MDLGGYDAFDHLIQSLCLQKQDLMAMLFTAYFDESGTYLGSGAVVVGGYVATVEQWQHFAREWNYILAGC